jgi:hypothetical protein
MATLFTRLIHDSGEGSAFGIVRFRRRWSGQVRIGAITDRSEIVVTADGNGFISVPLLGGDYRVWFGGSRPRLITIPDDDGTYLIEDLLDVTGGETPLTYRYRGAALELLNGTTGAFHGIRVIGTTTPQVSIDPVGDPVANYRWRQGALEFRNADLPGWHAIYLTGAGPDLLIHPADTLLSGHARTRSGRLELLNTTSNLFQPIYLSGASPGFVFGSGAA